MLKGCIAFVTGGGSGIGRATCQLFAEEGANVVVTDINEQQAKETAHDLPGNDHLHLKMDVSKSNDIDRAFDKVKTKYSSPPTICVNCAGLLVVEPFLDMTEETFYRLIDVNIKGTMMITQRACKELIAVGKPGSVVNIASVAVNGGPLVSLYAATKAAVDTFSKSVAKEMVKHNIRINTVLPGLVKTPMADTVPEGYMEEYIPQLALAQPADPKEIAQVIVFLASDRSSYVSGSSYTVHGGLI